ncbi:MAG: type II toxin-antitoxin system HicA family toxin [Ignavibacterium album]|nr:type II toxin-antitoxin system HicA family toxin [Ignavibacterium album]
MRKPESQTNGKIPGHCSEKESFRSSLSILGFSIVREREHISMIRENNDGTKTPLTMPNHNKIKSSTLRTICTQAGISREDFIDAYERS